MLAVEVVVVEPWVELLVAFERGLIGSGVRPFSESGLDEAFCFSVGTRGVGPGEAMLEISRLDDLPEAPVTCAAGFTRSVPVDAVAGLHDARQALDIEVDEAARPLVFVAHDRRRRIERLKPVHAVAAKGVNVGIPE